MSGPRKISPRLWALLARDEPVGVIFRRGPSKQVLLIKWNTTKDTFEFGQWFKGRIYERRCDLSPNGEYLIYFAAKQKPPLYSWTAISKPPYFTALALWPKGDCWNGGGWFVTDRKLRLNHYSFQSELAPNFSLKRIQVVGYADFGGEDATVWSTTLARDGWKLVSQKGNHFQEEVMGWLIGSSTRCRKPHVKQNDIFLEMTIVAIGGRGGPWYKIKYRLLERDTIMQDFGLIDWADWDHRGDLVYAKNGCLFRQCSSRRSFSEPIQIADFNDLKFEEVPPTPWAQRW